MPQMLNVLIVDDTIFYRKLLSQLVEAIPDAQVAGIASNGELAVKKIEMSAPDLVLMDVVMPKMDGIEALQQIKKTHSDVDVVMVSGMDKEAAAMTVKALEMGALDFIPKPKTKSADEAVETLKQALHPLLRLARTRMNSRMANRVSGAPKAERTTPRPSRPAPAVKEPPGPEAAGIATRTAPKTGKIPRIDLVALGVSTGGPNTLKRIIPSLEAALPVPILTVQHMPPVFTTTLAESLDRMSAIRVAEGEAEQVVEDGTMYIAPGGRHMVVRKHGITDIKIGLTDAPRVHNCRPAVDVLFRSIAAVFPGNVLTVILTGMGSDGAAGVAAIRRKGGYCLIQDKPTSVVWGMPGAVAEAGDADEIHPQDMIAHRIMQLVKRGRP